jgi:hypothetical protein
VRVERVIHTETQDGKSALDAYFARAAALLDRFMKHPRRNRIKAIATPRGLAAALAWNGGLPNCSVMLIEIDRLRLEELRNAVQDAVVVVKKHIKRTNDVVFYECENSDPIVSMANVQQAVERKLEFSFKAFEYSNIGSGCTLHFTLGKNATVRSSTGA